MASSFLLLETPYPRNTLCSSVVRSVNKQSHSLVWPGGEIVKHHMEAVSVKQNQAMAPSCVIKSINRNRLKSLFKKYISS